jgi:CubicO group peptidase (beta-lactamase class C family)
MRLVAALLGALLAATPHVNADTADVAPLFTAILSGKSPYAEPVPLAAYAMPYGAAPAQTEFKGRLRFEVAPADAHAKLLLDRWNFAKPGHEFGQPPAFDFGFVQVDGHLVPVERGIVPAAGEWWDWIVGPGRAWQDGDSGWSRASVPFALIEKNANCMHHGLLTFRYRGDSEVSRVAYQVSHETCYYFQFDAWGTAAATRVADPGINQPAVTVAYRIEVSRRLPIKPIEQISKDYPGLDSESFGSKEDIDPRDMTVFGVFIRGVHYSGGCATRRGRYPYCDEMPLPSYSLAKTLMAGLALMRAEALHPGARNMLVTDYVTECREAGGWDGVTFENLLDMASGHYDSPKSEADEDASNTGRFFIATTHAEKIQFACTHYPRKDPPGTRWVYHTSDTYILGAALTAWWKKEKGPEADFYRDLLVVPVFKRLGLSPELATPRRTVDDAAQPFTGWGLVLRRDDLAKLGGYFALGDGKLGKDTLFDPAMLRAAMQRDPADTGLPATDRNYRYNNGVWALNLAEKLGCKNPAWIPFMSGFGGISVVMMPNGIVYYYVSDGGTFRWSRVVAETHRIRTVCRDEKPNDG